MSTVASDELFRMPTLGADMTEGRVVEWLVTPGTEVARGDLVAVVETDKSDIEIEVFEPCVVEEFLVDLGELVDVGTPIARIRPLGASPGAPTSTPAAPTSTPAAPTSTPAAPTSAPEALPPPLVSSAVPRITPRARRLAAERGVDLSTLADTDRARIVTGDRVLQLQAPPVAPREEARSDSSMRTAIASAMERSWHTIPHYHVTSVIDVTDLAERLALRNAEVPAAERMLIAAPLHAAIARAAAEVPACNGWWQAGAFVAAERVDLGVVVALRTGGIIVPTIVAADQLDADTLMIQLRDVVERARRGRLRGSDLTPASITVTSLGERGARSVSGVIHPPQVALIGLGSVHDEATVVAGEVRPGRVVHLTVAGDHRAHDGLTAARLLTAVERHLEELP